MQKYKLNKHIIMDKKVNFTKCPLCGFQYTLSGVCMRCGHAFDECNRTQERRKFTVIEGGASAKPAIRVKNTQSYLELVSVL